MPTYSPRVTRSVSRCMLCEQEQNCSYFPDLEDYVCRECVSNDSYSNGNSLRMGRPNKLPSFSFEFEIGNTEAVNEFASHYCDEEIDDDEDDTFGSWYGPDRQGERILGRAGLDEFYSEALRLKQFGFTKCSDGTVYAEYKSPIYRDHLEMQQVIPVLNHMAHLVGKEAGTHIHVHFRHKQQLGRVYDRVLGPVLRYMRDNPRMTEDVWGRFFNDYCRGEHEEYTRYNAFNLDTSYQTLEFRLCKFKNGKQYRNLIRLVRKMAYTIDWYFDNVQRSSEVDCEELSGKLVNLIKKHAEKI